MYICVRITVGMDQLHLFAHLGQNPEALFLFPHDTSSARNLIYLANQSEGSYMACTTYSAQGRGCTEEHKVRTHFYSSSQGEKFQLRDCMSCFHSTNDTTIAVSIFICYSYILQYIRSELSNKPNCQNISACVDQRGFL